MIERMKDWKALVFESLLKHIPIFSPSTLKISKVHGLLCLAQSYLSSGIYAKSIGCHDDCSFNILALAIVWVIAVWLTRYKCITPKVLWGYFLLQGGWKLFQTLKCVITQSSISSIFGSEFSKIRRIFRAMLLAIELLYDLKVNAIPWFGSVTQ